MATIKPTSLAVIGVAYKADGSGKLGGFGHLVPQGEKSDALGIVYDSDVFPSQFSGVELPTPPLMRICETHHVLLSDPLACYHHSPTLIFSFLFFL